jgi:hypothetical protein
LRSAPSAPSEDSADRIHAGSSAIDASSANSSSWDVDPVTAELEHGQDVAAHGVAHHHEPGGFDADVAQDARVRLGVLLQEDLVVLEVVREPRRRDLARLVHQIALREEQQPVVAAELFEHFRHVGQQLDGLGEHLATELDQIADDPARP